MIDKHIWNVTSTLDVIYVLLLLYENKYNEQDTQFISNTCTSMNPAISVYDLTGV